VSFSLAMESNRHLASEPFFILKTNKLVVFYSCFIFVFTFLRIILSYSLFILATFSVFSIHPSNLG